MIDFVDGKDGSLRSMILGSRTGSSGGKTLLRYIHQETLTVRPRARVPQVGSDGLVNR